MRRIVKLLVVGAAISLCGLVARPALAQSSATTGPSFDCTRASTSVERAICADAELRALDLGIARFYASGMRNSRPGRAVRDQREWVAMRNRCDARACLRQAMMERLSVLSEAVGSDLPTYANSDADAELVIADLGGGWYAFGATGYYHGPTINSASASGAVRLQNGRSQIAPASEFDCAFTLARLPNDRWRLTARPAEENQACGGMNATVEGTYRRGRR